MNLRSGKTYNYFEKHPTALLIKQKMANWFSFVAETSFLPERNGVMSQERILWTGLQDTPFSKGEIDLCGWNSKDECDHAKLAWNNEEEDEEEFWIVIEKLKKEPYYNGNIFESANMQEQLHSEFGYNQSISWGLSNGWIDEEEEEEEE